MVLYECYCCNFSSKLKGDYNRHLKTNKHFNNINISLSAMVKSQKEPIKSQKEPMFFCDYCNSKFKTYANKRRHEIHRCNEISSIKENVKKDLLNEMVNGKLTNIQIESKIYTNKKAYHF